jgi:nicotinamidase-related amidase
MKTIQGITCFSTLREIVDPRHTGLLVVDMQNDFISTKGHYARYGKELTQIQRIVPRVALVVDEARVAGLPIYWVQQTTLKGLASDSPAWLYFKTRDGKSPDYTLDGSWGQRIVPALTPREGEPRVKKHRPSAFLNTALDSMLRNRGVETVICCGVLTQGCVLATAVDASFHDFYVVIASDAVQSTNQDLHAGALAFLGSRYDLVSVTDLAAIWAGSAVGGSTKGPA